MKHAYNNRLANREGERHHLSKLTKEDVIRIRDLYATGNYSQQKISEMFCVNRPAIQKIVNRERWNHI